MNSGKTHVPHAGGKEAQEPSTQKFGNASRLIGVPNDIFVVLHNSEPTEFGGYISVDDVVFSGRFKSNEAGERCASLMDTTQCDEVKDYPQETRWNRYRFMWSFDLGKSSVRVFIGWNAQGGKCDMRKFKVQYNPNKIGADKRIDLVLGKIGRFAKSVVLDRYDIAIDIPTARDNCRVYKDMRATYQYIRTPSSLTEYIGKKSHPGHVKLYDKTIELAEEQGIYVKECWTRWELTCSGEWNAEETKKHLGVLVVDSFCNDEKLTPEKQCIIRFVEMALKNNLPIDECIAPLDYRSRQRILQCMQSPELDISLSHIQRAIDVARAETARFGLF